jgi:hypothetical protein
MIQKRGLRARRPFRREAEMDGAGGSARSGPKVAARRVEPRCSSRQRFLLGPDDRKRWCRQWRLFMTSAAPRAATGVLGRQPGMVALRLGLVHRGGSLVVDVVAAGCLSGRRAAAKGGRDQIRPKSRHANKTPACRLPCHGACSIDVETPRKEMLTPASANCNGAAKKPDRSKRIIPVAGSVSKSFLFVRAQFIPPQTPPPP